jgi:hypothetical protein
VAHQRAADALGQVVLGVGETVVDEEGRAAFEAVGEGANKGFGLRMDLGRGAGAKVASTGGRRRVGRSAKTKPSA